MQALHGRVPREHRSLKGPPCTGRRLLLVVVPPRRAITHTRAPRPTPGLLSTVYAAASLVSTFWMPLFRCQSPLFLAPTSFVCPSPGLGAAHSPPSETALGTARWTPPRYRVALLHSSIRPSFLSAGLVSLPSAPRSDKFGRKQAVMLSVFGSLSGFVLQGEPGAPMPRRRLCAGR